MPAADDFARGRTSLLIAVAAAAVLAVGTYASTLNHPLLLDDTRATVANPSAQSAADLRTILLTPSWAPNDGASGGWHPLATWTFALTRARFGASPYAYHVVNVAAHALTAALVV